MKKSLKQSFLLAAILPVVFLGIIVTFFSVKSVYNALEKEVESELYSVAGGVETYLDIMYPGDYVQVGEEELVLFKGEKTLNDRFEFLDGIKEKTGLDISLFFGNIRFLTTFTDVNGERLLGVRTHLLVEHEVLQGGVGKLYNNVEINGQRYFTYYYPLKNADSACVGMIEVAKSAAEVESMVYKSAMPSLFVSFLVMVLAIIFTLNYSTKLVTDITKLQNFMKDVSGGNLRKKFDSGSIRRNDEIEDMCNSALEMQRSLRKYIESDPLTQLDNRRGANATLKEYEDGPYTIVMGDIDFFKKVNDTYGHDAGDIVLKEVANVLKKNMRGRGFAARWGGEEFMLGFKSENLTHILKCVEEVLDEIREKEIICGENTIKITMSFGIATKMPEMSIEEVIKQADERLYLAKTGGRNQIICPVEENESLETAEEKVRVDSDILDYINELKGERDGGTDI